VLDAQYFGVPQRRRRVFIVGCLGNSGGSPEEILAIAEGRAGYLAKSNKKREDTAGGTSGGAGSGSSIGNFELYDFPEEPVSPTLSANRAHDTMTYRVELSNQAKVANCLPAELYHKSTVVNQDVNSGHLVVRKK
jgi:site-specific DNA-cytosine methylase